MIKFCKKYTNVTSIIGDTETLYLAYAHKFICALLRGIHRNSINYARAKILCKVCS